MRLALFLLFVILLTGCSPNPAEVLPGAWSSGQQGQVLDISPNGLYAEVWLESKVSISSWKLDGDDLLITPVSPDLPTETRQPDYRFNDDGLEFLKEKSGYLRYVREAREKTADPDLVGLWQRDSKSYRKEFIEFTPWSTVIWTRWTDEDGVQKLVSGWSTYRMSKDDNLIFFSTLEDGEWMQWSKQVSYDTTASTLTITMPSPIGEKTYTRGSKEELLKMAQSLDR